MQWGGIMDWYKIINTKNGRSYIFNQKSISLMEQERLDLFLTLKQFAKHYAIPLRNYQRVIAKEQVGRKVAHSIIKKILKKYEVMTSKYDSYNDLDKEFAYLDGLASKR
jgi:hypothetical protein